jgi:hypothetical protein
MRDGRLGCLRRRGLSRYVVVAAILVFRAAGKDVDGRDERGHDDVEGPAITKLRPSGITP